MTTISDLATSVYTLTNRPDLVAETQLAIQKATLQEHAAIDYPSDLVTSSVITLDNTSGTFRYTVSLTTAGIAAEVRKIKFVKEALDVPPVVWQSSMGYWGEIDFKEIAPNAIFDNYNMEQVNYYFRQGLSLSLVAYRRVNKIALIYYALPDTTVLTYSSWIADKFPYVIYERAAADIFKLVGKTDEQAAYLANMHRNRLDVITSEVGPIG
jgi:hypothetical protein